MKQEISIAEIYQNNRSPLVICDVRAPVEFLQGSIPGSVNLPLLEDEERAQVGKCYRARGQTAAVELGHQLVSGPLKELRLSSWVSFFTKNPDSALTCFRGGLRSQTVQAWLAVQGLHVPRLRGGYKEARSYYLQQIQDFSESAQMMVVSGATGSGKTRLIRHQKLASWTLDLERFAHHRGSAFGGFTTPQPGQADFENQVAVRCLQLRGFSDVLLEDESRMIGRCVQPEVLYERLRKSPVIIINETLQARTEETFQEYIENSPLAWQEGPTNLESPEFKAGQEIYFGFCRSLGNISRKLGGARAAEIRADLDQAWQAQLVGKGREMHRIWIHKLLEWYYDPLYINSLERRQPLVMFEGTRLECEKFLLQRPPSQTSS